MIAQAKPVDPYAPFRRERTSSLESELQRLKAVQASLLRQREELILDHKLDFFRPNSPKQILFFEKANTRRRAIFAGNRFGKTTLGVAEDISWSRGFRSWYPEGHPLRTLGIPQDRGTRGLVIAQDWDRVRELFTDDQSRDKPGKFFEWAPKGSIYKTHRRQNGVIDQIYFRTLQPNGTVRESSILFDTVKSFKADGLSQESLDWDFIHVDEPMPEDMYNAVSRGLIDRGGFMWMLLTPLREIWMYTFMTEGQAEQPDIFWSATADMTDNPELSQTEIDLFLANLSPAERACREQGIPLAYGSLVYDRFNESEHVLDRTPAGWANSFTPPRDWQVLVSIDTHAKTPHAVLFLAISETHVVIFREIWKHCLISELCKEIKDALKGLRVDAIICDPIAWIENPETGRAWADTFFEHGLDISKASKQKAVGIIETNQIWDKTYHKKVRVLSHCRHFLKEIRNYFFDKDDKPVDKDDHFMECLYRSVLHNHFAYYPEYVPTAVGQSFYNDNVISFDENSKAIMQI